MKTTFDQIIDIFSYSKPVDAIVIVLDFILSKVNNNNNCKNWISLKGQSVLGWLAKNNNKNNNNGNKKSYSLYKVVSVGEEFWVSPWFVSHVINIILGAYDYGGHFNCYIVEMGFFNAYLFANVKK